MVFLQGMGRFVPHPFREVPLSSSFDVDTQAYLVENGGIVITNPNAPTGIYKPLDQIEEIVKANQSVVVIIDEAYINFGGETALPLLEKYDNVFITRTFSRMPPLLVCVSVTA